VYVMDPVFQESGSIASSNIWRTIEYVFYNHLSKSRKFISLRKLRCDNSLVFV